MDVFVVGSGVPIARAAVQDEEKWMIHMLEIHDAKHRVFVDLAKYIVDWELIINHGSAGYASIARHAQPGSGTRGREQRHGELK